MMSRFAVRRDIVNFFFGVVVVLSGDRAAPFPE